MQSGRFELAQETEEAGRWVFRFERRSADGALERHDLRLAWPDYDVFSPDGTATPAAVARAVMRWFEGWLAADSERTLPVRLDAARARRLAPGADEAIRSILLDEPPGDDAGPGRR